MKTFQKITLAAAISAAPFMAQAELTPMDDALMGDTTGQAGVTVEINIDGGGISVGEIEYTDEGSVLIQNVNISNVNNLTQTIDVNAKGDLEIGMSDVDNIGISIGGDGLTSAVALKSTAGEVTELVNNVDITLDVGAHTTYIRNLASRDAAAMTALGIPAAAQDGSVAIQSTVAVRIDDMNVGAFGYTLAQATTKQGQISAGVAGSVAGTDLKAAELIAAYNTATGSAVDATVVAGTALTTDQEGAVLGAISNGAAVNIKGVEFYQDTSAQPGGSAKDYATIAQTIWAKGGSSALGGGVYIQIGEIKGTLEVGAIEIGGASIGSVKVSDINLAGLTQRIYGHN